MVSEPDKIYRMQVSVEFPTESVMNTLRSEIETFAKNHGMQPIVSLRVGYSHCRLCGRPRWFQAMGFGEEECRPAYARSCQAWQKQGGWKPAA